MCWPCRPVSLHTVGYPTLFAEDNASLCLQLFSYNYVVIVSPPRSQWHPSMLLVSVRAERAKDVGFGLELGLGFE